MEKKSIISNTTTQPGETEQVTIIALTEEGMFTLSATQIDNNVGPCPECGNAVIQLADGFACNQVVDGRCNFSIETADIEAAYKANVFDVVLDAIICGDA